MMSAADGICLQTSESIGCAEELQLPAVVALNKMDLVPDTEAAQVIACVYNTGFACIRVVMRRLILQTCLVYFGHMQFLQLSGLSERPAPQARVLRHTTHVPLTRAELA